MTLGNLNTTKTWAESLSDLRDEFRKWDVDDYLLPTKKESSARKEVSVAFAVRGNWVTPTCRRWQPGENDWLERNLRAIVLAVQSTRLADQRGLGALLAETAKAVALPAVDPDDPHLILGVASSASTYDVKMAYRELVKQHHPDVGGNPDLFRRINDAGQRLGVA